MDSELAPASRAPRVGQLLELPYNSGGGLLWSVVLRERVGCAGDDVADPWRSQLVLFEDGAELGPAHAPHAAIREQGRGAYSHWGGSLLFSTSDGSDPNTNGRRYAVAVGPAKPVVLAFGSCHINDAVAGLGAKRLARPSWTRPVLTYSTSEALQLLRWSRGELVIPPHLLPFTSLLDDGPPAPPHRPDAVFLEVATNVEIRHGSVVVSRESLTRRVFEPALALGRAEGRVAKRWYHQGLQRGDETLRAALAAELADLVRRHDGGSPDMDLVLGARSHRQDAAEVARGMEEMREAVGRPLCVISTPAVYTRDGRPVSWPTYFPGELADICRAIDLPLLSLSDLVARHGVDLSVQPDLHHYTPAFIGVLGDAMMAMTRRLLGTDDQAGRTLDATTEADGPEKAPER